MHNAKQPEEEPTISYFEADLLFSYVQLPSKSGQNAEVVQLSVEAISAINQLPRQKQRHFKFSNQPGDAHEASRLDQNSNRTCGDCLEESLSIWLELNRRFVSAGAKTLAEARDVMAATFGPSLHVTAYRSRQAREGRLTRVDNTVTGVKFTKLITAALPIIERKFQHYNELQFMDVKVVHNDVQLFIDVTVTNAQAPHPVRGKKGSIYNDEYVASTMNKKRSTHDAQSGIKHVEFLLWHVTTIREVLLELMEHSDYRGAKNLWNKYVTSRFSDLIGSVQINTRGTEVLPITEPDVDGDTEMFDVIAERVFQRQVSRGDLTPTVDSIRSQVESALMHEIGEHDAGVIRGIMSRVIGRLVETVQVLLSNEIVEVEVTDWALQRQPDCTDREIAEELDRCYQLRPECLPEGYLDPSNSESYERFLANKVKQIRDRMRKR